MTKKNSKNGKKAWQSNSPKFLKVKKINTEQWNEEIEQESDALNPEGVSAEDIDKNKENDPVDNPDIKDEELENYLTAKQVLFCKYFTSWDIQFRANWTRAYSKAYWYYERCKKDPIWIDDNAITICNSSASRLLRNVSILRYIRYINNHSVTDESVHAELSLLIYQRADTNTKIRAIDLWAKINWKITGKLDAKVQHEWTILNITKTYEKPVKKPKKKK